MDQELNIPPCGGTIKKNSYCNKCGKDVNGYTFSQYEAERQMYQAEQEAELAARNPNVVQQEGFDRIAGRLNDLDHALFYMQESIDNLTNAIKENSKK